MTDQNTKELVITRVFDAPRELVWKAWTDPAMVKKWWGPKVLTAPSAQSDFRVGGKYVYAMHGPAGSEWDKDMYSGGEFKEIVPLQKIVVTDYFTDEHGNKIKPTEAGMESGDFPDESTVTITFADEGSGKTKLAITYPVPESEAGRKAMLDSGMEQGWNQTLDKFAKVVEEK